MNGGEDFIPDAVFDDYIDLCKKNDAVVMGRKTYDFMQKYDRALLDKFESLSIKKIVVSSDKNFKLKGGYLKTITPEMAVSLEVNILVSSGPNLNSYLLKNHLIDQILLNRLIGINLGKGIKPFDVDTKTFLNNPISVENKEGRELLTYNLVKV